MAALTDSYQPKGLPFSQHYPGTSRDFDDEELDEGDIVKSKPKPSSYLPLVNEPPYRGEEASDGRGEGAEGYHARQKHGGRQSEEISVVSGVSSEISCPLPLNGRIPASASVSATAAPRDRGLEPRSSGSGGQHPGNEPTPLQTSSTTTTSTAPPPLASSAASARANPQADDEEEEEDEDRRDLEESTTALLRRYTMERNGRPTSIHLGPSGEMVGSGWLSEILVTNHKKCSVTLEEDYITWRYLSRKDGESPPSQSSISSLTSTSPQSTVGGANYNTL